MKNFSPKVIALGGSIVVPDTINVEYLKRLRAFFISYFADGGDPIMLVVGGGSTARNYQNAAAEVASVSDEDKDWLGIHATRINAQLLRTIFVDIAHPVVLNNPHKHINASALQQYRLFIASGGLPGHSTDYDAVAIAQRFNVAEFLIATTISYVYDKDFSKYKDAQPIKDLTWEAYRALVDDVWKPGMKAPVDPVAARAAEKYGMECRLFQGTNLFHFEQCLKGEEFEGTVIHP